MKRVVIILLLGCLWFVVSCGPKGPRTVHKEGFVLEYNTLDLDLRPLVLPGYRLSFERAVKEGDGYLCLFSQQSVYNCFIPPIKKKILLKVDPKTGTFHQVDHPCPLLAKDRLTVWNDTVYLLVKEPPGKYRFVPENETWEEVPFNEDIIYEDDYWRVVSRDIHYAKTHTWFIDRKTGEEYFFPIKPVQILRYNGYYYLTDRARFRGIADPRDGFPCDSTSTYEAVMEDSPNYSFNVYHSLAERGGKSFKTAADIYAFGEGDDGYSGCDHTPSIPDTVFNASFPAKGSLYQMVTTPSSSYVAQVTGKGLNWIIDLGKRYETWGVGTVKNYEDGTNSFGIIDLGDTLRFLHIRHNVDSLAYSGDTGLSMVLKEILRGNNISRKEMRALMEEAGFSFLSSYSTDCDAQDGFIYCKVADADWTGWAKWEFSVNSDTLSSIMLKQGLTPYFDGSYREDRKGAQGKAKSQELIDMVSRIVGQEPTLTDYGERIWTTGGWSILTTDKGDFGYLTITPSASE